MEKPYTIAPYMVEHCLQNNICLRVFFTAPKSKKMMDYDFQRPPEQFDQKKTKVLIEALDENGNIIVDDEGDTIYDEKIDYGPLDEVICMSLPADAEDEFDILGKRISYNKFLKFVRASKKIEAHPYKRMTCGEPLSPQEHNRRMKIIKGKIHRMWGSKTSKI